MTKVEADPGVSQLYDDFAKAGLLPLWTQREGLMSMVPEPTAVPHLWPWAGVLPLAERAGERPQRCGRRSSTSCPTRWPRPTVTAKAPSASWWRVRESAPWSTATGRDAPRRPPPHARLELARAPKHRRWADGVARRARHSAGRPARQRVFRVRPRRDHRSVDPAALAGRAPLDTPGAAPGVGPRHGQLAARRLPVGADRWRPAGSARPRGRGSPGCRRTGARGGAVLEPDDRARCAGDVTDRDASLLGRSDGSDPPAGRLSVWQVFERSGTFELGPQRFEVTRGDVVAIPSWCPARIVADSTLDAFAFSDAPVDEALKLYRTAIEQ